MKRICVGVCIWAWYTAPIFIHPLAEVIFVVPMCLTAHREIHNIRVKSFEEKPMMVGFRHFISFVLIFIGLTRFGMLDRSILERTGFSVNSHPILFMVLYERQNEMTVLLTAISFLFMMCNWRERNLRY
jgi:hypothetical protein